MFTAHTLVHHQLCKHDDTFQVHDEEQEEALTFQWWGGPLLIALNLVPWAAGWWLLRASGLPVSLFIASLITVAVVFFIYYGAYEGFHYLMHRPKIAWIERSRFFKFLERHHRIHHAHMGKNFNVVLPLADLFLGTLLLRDPAPPQTTSPSARAVARRHSRFGRKLQEQASGAEVSEAPDAERTPR